MMKLIIENWRKYLNEIALKEVAAGLCYPFANKMASKWIDDHIEVTKGRGRNKIHPDMDNKDKFKVVHGEVTDQFSGEKYLHAWVEMGDVVFDWQTSEGEGSQGVPKAEYDKIYKRDPHNEYTAEEASLLCLRTQKQGPWP